MTNTPQHVHISSGGVSVVFDLAGARLPLVVHWGTAVDAATAAEIVATSAPAAMNSSLDSARGFTIAAGESTGWSGTPALHWHADGVPGSQLSLRSVAATATTADFTLIDERLEVEADISYALDSGGVLSVRAKVTNTGPRTIDVVAARQLLPIPARAVELLDQTGKWSGEHRPQRRDIVHGTTLRATRRGRPGHDSPVLSIAGTRGFAFRSGEVWATHLAWSGNGEYVTEKLPEGAGSLSAVVGAAELLAPGEIRLAGGESYTTPEVLFAWSDRGIDGVSERFHARVRAGSAYPRSPRPLVLNTWEAVYFDHDLERLTLLARQAADIGVERFVLDDGWFLGRRGDTAGLGDWIIDPTVWPHGLTDLSDVVHELGMQFGLWFEPEMVNLDSEVARSHPEWVLGHPQDATLSWRNQFVLDLSNPDAYAHVLSQMTQVIAESRVDFIKWDHNRDLLVAEGLTSRPRVHAQTEAVYRLMDTLRADHPGLEIEACASGGARIDLGMMSHAQRVWTSDTNDPVERQMIQRWASTLLPPELQGAHVGPEEAHTTHRVSALQFRLITALFGHSGIEWDLTALTDVERSSLATWADLYREFRGLIATGATVRADEVDDGALLHGIVSQDRGHALFAWLRLSTSATAHTDRVRIPGLQADRRYSVRIRDELGSASRHQVRDPEWMARLEGRAFSSAMLDQIGVPLPLLNPGYGMLLEFTAID
jgi:alpha-galactosidase